MRNEVEWTGVCRVHLTQEHEVDSSIEDLKVNQSKLQSRCHGRMSGASRVMSCSSAKYHITPTTEAICTCVIVCEDRTCFT
jgi:hypothetical protein